jgi:hypothetical protein
MSNQKMHSYKYVQSHVIILHLHIFVTPVTIIILFCYKNTLNVQISVWKMCDETTWQ